jgi:hypothetical protein
MKWIMGIAVLLICGAIAYVIISGELAKAPSSAPVLSTEQVAEAFKDALKETPPANVIKPTPEQIEGASIT